MLTTYFTTKTKNQWSELVLSKGKIKFNDKWFRIVEQNWSSVLGGNALLLPFALPLIVWLVICQCYSALLKDAMDAIGGALILTCVGLLPCVLIYFVGIAGTVNVNKSILFDGSANVAKSFRQGIKKNALRYLLFGFVMWLSFSVAVITPSLYSLMGKGLLHGMGSVVAIVQAFAVIPITCLAITQSAFYNDNLHDCFANAVKLYFIRPLKTIGLTIVAMIPFCICVFLPFVWQLVFWVVYMVVGVSFGLIFLLVCHKAYFDWVIAQSQQQK